MKKLLLLAVITAFSAQTAFGLLGGNGGKQSAASRQLMAKRKACKAKGYNWVRNHCVKPGAKAMAAPQNIGANGKQHLMGPGGTRQLLGGGVQSAASQQYMANRQKCEVKGYNWVQSGAETGYCVKPGLMGATR